MSVVTVHVNSMSSCINQPIKVKALIGAKDCQRKIEFSGKESLPIWLTCVVYTFEAINN